MSKQTKVTANKFDIAMHAVAAAIIVAYLTMTIVVTHNNKENAKKSSDKESASISPRTQRQLQQYSTYYQQHLNQLQKQK